MYLGSLLVRGIGERRGEKMGGRNYRMRNSDKGKREKEIQGIMVRQMTRNGKRGSRDEGEETLRSENGR